MRTSRTSRESHLARRAAPPARAELRFGEFATTSCTFVVAAPEQNSRSSAGVSHRTASILPFATHCQRRRFQSFVDFPLNYFHCARASWQRSTTRPAATTRMSSERVLQALVLEYLEGKKSSVADPDGLDVAIQCIAEAFDLSAAARSAALPMSEK